MLNTSNVFLKVATIVSTILGALALATVPFYFVVGFSNVIHNMLVDAMSDGTINVQNTSLSFEEIAVLLQGMFIGLGFMLLVLGGICVTNAIISSMTRREPTRGRYIACIVTGALSTDFSIIAGILGLINLSREKRQKEFEE